MKITITLEWDGDPLKVSELPHLITLARVLLMDDNGISFNNHDGERDIDSQDFWSEDFPKALRSLLSSAEVLAWGRYQLQPSDLWSDFGRDGMEWDRAIHAMQCVIAAVERLRPLPPDQEQEEARRKD